MRATLIGAALLIQTVALTATGSIAQTNGIEVWYETFGERVAKPLLLNMGYGCSGLSWPSEWCEELANSGFYVIRYDYRDTGRSTSIDFDANPYDYIEMARDAVGLLDALEIETAHVVGFSMGGPISQIMAVRHPERVETITLMATSSDFRPSTSAMLGEPFKKEGWLSPPRTDYMIGAAKLFARPIETVDEFIDLKVNFGQLMNGSEANFDAAYWRAVQMAILAHTGDTRSSRNHQRAYLRFEEIVGTISSAVRVPTLILHGTADPLFRRDHAERLAGSIEGARLVWVEGMGHYPNPAFYDQWKREICNHTRVS